jgi:ribosomal protein S18 acetylase RimI-like enzyme
MTIRRGSPEDASALAELAMRTFHDTYAEFNTAEDMRAYLERVYGVEQQTRELSDPGMITVLADSPDGLVGFAQVRRGEAPSCVGQDDAVEVYRFYVDRGAHGTGVAARLMDGVKTAARDLGGRRLWLGVWERNPRAIAFYRKSGFSDAGTTTFQLGSDLQTDRVMVASLLPGDGAG